MKAILTVAVVASAAFVSPARAADPTVWTGRDTGNKQVFWSLSKVLGDSWVLKEQGKKFADCTATQVKGDFVELKMSGGGKVRVFNGKLQMTKPGTNTAWFDVASGKWAN